jgi:hypothetical protein
MKLKKFFKLFTSCNMHTEREIIITDSVGIYLKRYVTKVPKNCPRSLELKYICSPELLHVQLLTLAGL